MSALAGTISAPFETEGDVAVGRLLRAAISLLAAVAMLAVALPVAFGKAGGESGADPLRVFSSGALAAPQVGGDTSLSIAGMTPGQSRSAVVQVSSEETSALSVVPRLLDRPGPGGLALSAALRLRVESASGTVLFAGSLAAMHRLNLGSLDAGGPRAYRFTVALPSGVGNAVEDSSLSARFVWFAA